MQVEVSAYVAIKCKVLFREYQEHLLSRKTATQTISIVIKRCVSLHHHLHFKYTTAV